MAREAINWNTIVTSITSIASIAGVIYYVNEHLNHEEERKRHEEERKRHEEERKRHEEEQKRYEEEQLKYSDERRYDVIKAAMLTEITTKPFLYPELCIPEQVAVMRDIVFSDTARVVLIEGAQGKLA